MMTLKMIMKTEWASKFDKKENKYVNYPATKVVGLKKPYVDQTKY